MGTITSDIPWAEWVIDRYIGKTENSAYLEVHNKNTDEKATIERRDLYLPDEFEMQLRSKGASIKNYSDYYMNEAVGRIQMAQKLNSIPGFIRVEEYKTVPNPVAGYTVFIRREYADSLIEYRFKHNMALTEIAEGVVELCDAVEECHKQSILLGGIRPDTVFVKSDKHFALGTEYFFALRNMGEKVDRFFLAGLDDSAAPETLNKGEITPVSDVYCLGLLLFYFFNKGKIPFLPLTEKKSNGYARIGAVERRLRGEAIPRPVEGTDEMAAVIRKACEFEPEKRYQSVAELKKALVDLLKEEMVVPMIPKDEDEDDPDDEGTEDYRAEMEARAKAERYKFNEKEYLASFNRVADTPSSDNGNRKSTKTKKMRIIAACFVAGFIILQAFSVFYQNGFRSQKAQETEVQTEAETQAETVLETESETETAN